MPKSNLLWVIFAVAIPAATWFGLPLAPPLRTLAEPAASGGSRYPASPLEFDRREIGAPFESRRPLIANVQIVDFDGDGRQDVLACDIRGQCIVLCRRDANGEWHEEILADDIDTPAHVTVVDLDRDGDNDLLVSVLGDILPNDGVIGRLIWLENTPTGFERHVILDDVRRVADCQAGDLDGDGDIDLAVAVFGYARGQVLWLENKGDQRFIPHELLSAPGTIHVPLADFDGDGDLDIATVVSQDEEELWGFENLGGGEFKPRRLWFTVNHDLGSAGLLADDLDGDGDVDLILPVGDNLEVTHSYPQPYHGCLWFENEGNWKFTQHRIGDLGGTYAAAVGDLDGDGDRDVVLVSMFNNWDEPRNASVVWLENDGRCQFKTWQIDTRPTHRVTVALGDLDGDGRDDILTGGMHLVGPFDRLGRLTAWFNASGRSTP
jgi:hypothetical protein